MNKFAEFAGIVASDGHLSKDMSTICIINKDSEFIEYAENLCCEVIGKKPSKRIVLSGYGHEKYLLRVCSTKTLRLLNEKFNIPIGAESIQPPKKLEADEEISYLLGWIAGDGSVTNDRTRLKLEIWSKSKDMIEWFSKLMEVHGIETRIFQERKKNEYIMRIGKKKDVKKFAENFKIPHSKKQKKLMVLFS